MTADDFLKSLNAVKKLRQCELEIPVAWPLSRLYDLVPEGMVEKHPGKNIVLIFSLDDQRVLIYGTPGENDSLVDARAIAIPFPDRKAN